jgi:hypothetical protein
MWLNERECATVDRLRAEEMHRAVLAIVAPSDAYTKRYTEFIATSNQRKSAERACRSLPDRR